MDARPFDTIHDILPCLSLTQSLLKGRNAPEAPEARSGTQAYETVGNRPVTILEPYLSSSPVFQFWVVSWRRGIDKGETDGD